MTALIDPPLAHHAPDRARRRRLTPERAGVLALLVATGVAYLWSLSASGYANSFYSAAAQAGSQSWKAFFFGSLDAGNSITVDKPPAALWLMDLSVRTFGLSSWSILVPEALLGVATVAMTYALVRRVAAAPAALAAGALTALTPSAALMFRFNNPDALLLLLLVAAGYATLRAGEEARARWLVLAGTLIGFAFLTKMLQAFLVLPAFALVYLLVAPTTLRRRLLHLAGAGLSVIVSAGWWIAIVELWPASSRPYIDGSTNDSILQLVLGYNGLGRITGDETGGLGNFGFSSGTGPLRLFEGVSGGMVSWLLPAALIVLVAGLVTLRRAPRTDSTRAALLLSGGAMVTTGLVFSFMGGIYHDYYTVALAPWIALTAVLGGVVLWRRRELAVTRSGLALAVAVTGVWAFVLLGQSGEQPYDALRWLVLPAAIACAGLLLVADRLGRPTAAGLLVAALVVVGAGPAAYSIDTIATPHTGSIVTAGPVSSFGLGGHGGPGGGFGGQGFPGGAPTGGTQAGGGPMGGFGGGTPGGMAGGTTGGTGTQAAGGAPGGFGAGGGLLDGADVSDQLAALLEQNAGDYTWVAATARSQSAASYQLATGDAVMSIGGFNGTADSPTLAQFQADVAAGRIHYYVAGTGGGGDAGSLSAGATGGFSAGGPGGQSESDTAASQIESWVESTFTATTVDGTTVYDLTAPTTTTTTTGTTGVSA